MTDTDDFEPGADDRLYRGRYSTFKKVNDRVTLSVGSCEGWAKDEEAFRRMVAEELAHKGDVAVDQIEDVTDE